MKKITLTNDFHKTEITVLSNFDTASETWYNIQLARWDGFAPPAAKAKYRRVYRALCGIDGCCCGTVRKVV